MRQLDRQTLKIRKSSVCKGLFGKGQGLSELIFVNFVTITGRFCFVTGLQILENASHCKMNGYTVVTLQDGWPAACHASSNAVMINIKRHPADACTRNRKPTS